MISSERLAVTGEEMGASTDDDHIVDPGRLLRPRPPAGQRRLLLLRVAGGQREALTAPGTLAAREPGEAHRMGTSPAAAAVKVP